MAEIEGTQGHSPGELDFFLFSHIFHNQWNARELFAKMESGQKRIGGDCASVQRMGRFLRLNHWME